MFPSCSGCQLTQITYSVNPDNLQSAHLEPLQVAPDLLGPAAGAEGGAVLGAGHLELDVELEDGAQPIAAARADGAAHQPHQLL
jgi:hypothetical protein